MTSGAGIGNFIFVGHLRGDNPKRVRVDKCPGDPFSLDLWHVTRHALAAGATVFVVGVFSQRCGAWAVG